MFTKLERSQVAILLDLTRIGTDGDDLNNVSAFGKANGFSSFLRPDMLRVSWGTVE